MTICRAAEHRIAEQIALLERTGPFQGKRKARCSWRDLASCLMKSCSDQVVQEQAGFQEFCLPSVQGQMPS
jgi:hypothetical protein